MFGLAGRGLAVGDGGGRQGLLFRLAVGGGHDRGGGGIHARPDGVEVKPGVNCGCSDVLVPLGAVVWPEGFFRFPNQRSRKPILDSNVIDMILPANPAAATAKFSPYATGGSFVRAARLRSEATPGQAPQPAPAER